MQSRLAQQTGITTVSDAQLLAAYRDREDATAYSELVRRHQIPVYRLLTGLLADPDSAEAACEDVFVRAARRLDELPDPEQLEAWLTALARELARERQDQEPRRHTRVALNATLAAGQGRKVMGGAVREVLAELSPEHRSVLILAELHGEPVERIARTLGDSLRVVRQRLTAARKRFVEALTVQRQRTEAARQLAQPTPQPTVGMSGPDLVAPGYRVDGLLGAGGMGQVFLAEQISTRRMVALKVLAPERARSLALRERFNREAAAMQAVRHANLVEFIEHGPTHDGGLFLAMERLQGAELFDLLGGAPMPVRRTLHIVRHVLVGLYHLHQQDIVHRDVKPENVFVIERDGDKSFAKLIDLGIARLPPSMVSEQSETRLTGAGMALGTPAYIAPEQALGAEVDGRADLYAVSVMLFEMLTGRLPFDGGDAGAMLAMHVSATPPRLREVTPKLAGGAALEPLLTRGLAKERDQRFVDAKAYAAALDEVAATLR